MYFLDKLSNNNNNNNNNNEQWTQYIKVNLKKKKNYASHTSLFVYDYLSRIVLEY